MNYLTYLLKTILLILEEKKKLNTISVLPLAREIINIYNNKIKKEIANINGSTRDLIDGLINMLKNLISNDEIDVKDYAETLQIMLTEKTGLLKIAAQRLDEEEFDEDKFKSRKTEIENYIKSLMLSDLLYESYIKSKRGNVNINKLIANLKSELNKIDDYSPIIDDSVIDAVNFRNKDNLKKAIKTINNLINDDEILKTGWECINNMLQGGFRRGEFVTIAALPHNYKSGLTKSLFLQLTRLNKPKVKKGKKPLAIFITLEEKINEVLLFFYSYFKYLKENIRIDFKDLISGKIKIDEDEIYETLEKYFYNESNYEIEVLKLDPNKTSPENIIKIINNYEKEGFEIHMMFVDYLSQITQGLIKTGPQGTEYKELFKTIRNEIGKKNILFITPHQISTEAKNLIRNGIPHTEFVKHLVGKGYYAHSKQLDQEIDLELFIHKAKLNKDYVLTIQKGKHRLTFINDDINNFAMLKFPKKAPIPEGDSCIDPTIIEDDFEF